MCRIAGIASLSKPVEELQHTVAAMCHSLQHGGPDDEGIYTAEDHNLVLGHRRLALIDLSPSGHQPMHYHQFTITFNGEIYNYRELKAELQTLGFSFATTSDTEVILAAFTAWGTASFKRLNGMFAFALYDRQRADIYLVRDAVGIKPLYYFSDGTTIAFASEVRAFAHVVEAAEPHPHWPVYLMAYGHLPEPVTTLKKVKPLRKGTFLQYNLGTGMGREELYTHLSFLEKDCTRAEALNSVREGLKKAVERHLLADAPIGVFLSGGIDSSIVALLAGSLLGPKLNTLSLHFKEKGFSEKSYQDLVLQDLQARHWSHQLSKAEFHFNLPDILEGMDLPTSDGLNTWFISRNAKEAGLKAVLSGLGGDELFGGYPSFNRLALATRLQSLPSAALRAGRFGGSRRAKRLAFLSLGGVRGLYLFLRGQFTPYDIAAYLDMAEAEVWQVLDSQPLVPDIHHLTPQNGASWMELNLYMQNQLLRDSDVMSMAHGIEIRVPFLDGDFVRTALGLPSGIKYAGSFGKQLLIDAFKERLPEEVWNRKKMGFSFPFTQWMKEDEWVAAKMMGGDRRSAEMMKRFEQGSIHWSALMTTLLLRTHNSEPQPAFFNA